MAIDAIKACLKNSRAKGNARLVLISLAQYANHEDVKAGKPAIAFASQNTLARLCGCSRSTVQLALAELQELHEIRDTGDRAKQYRGTVVWEILPQIDLTDPRSTDLRSGDRSSDRPDRSSPALTDSTVAPDRPVGHKPAGNPQVKEGNEKAPVALAPDIDRLQLQKAQKLQFLKANRADAHEPERADQLIAALEDELACTVEVDRSLDRLAVAA